MSGLGILFYIITAFTAVVSIFWHVSKEFFCRLELQKINTSAYLVEGAFKESRGTGSIYVTEQEIVSRMADSAIRVDYLWNKKKIVPHMIKLGLLGEEWVKENGKIIRFYYFLNLRKVDNDRKNRRKA